MGRITSRHWRRGSLVLLGLTALAAAGLLLYVTWVLLYVHPVAFFALLALILAGIAGLLRWLYRAVPGREKPTEPFPEAWRAILLDRVVWYRRLTEEERRRFEESVQSFLSDTRITGVETEVDDEVRLLVAASAMIPVFGYPGWRYAGLEEVLIYPRPFSDNYELEGPEADLLGLMGEEELSRVILLSKPDLLAGFRRADWGPSPGIHEFIHRFDAADGALDGIPSLGESDPEGWLWLVDREMDRIERGASRLDPYAATDDVEFLAVAAEVFFLRPDILYLDHPELYRRLSRIFRQDPVDRQRGVPPRRQASPYTFRPKRRRRTGQGREKEE